MNRSRFSLMLFAAITLPALCLATDFTFDPPGTTTGDWQSTTNWRPHNRGWPVAGDTATIPSGYTCEITTNESIDSFTVSAAATLKLLGKTFTVNTSATCTIDGSFILDNDGSGNPPTLKLPASILFDSSSGGTLTAPIPCGGMGCAPAVITYKQFSSGAILEIGSGLTVRGSIDFDGADVNIASGGYLVVDDDDYVMRLGTNAHTVDLIGSGTAIISAGRMEFDWVHGDSSSDWLMNVSGGILKVGANTSLSATDLKLHLSDGFLDIDNNWSGKECVSSGGTIDVAPNKTLFFQE